MSSVDIAAGRDSHRSHDVTAPRVLLAEDDQEMRRMLAATLRKDGCDVVEVCDGRELLQWLTANRLKNGPDEGLDLLISDVRLPGHGGLDVLAGMRWADWRVPVVLITGFADAATHAEARRLGASALFDKPFDLDDFRTIVWNLLW
ncbi:MAG: response regulator [Polyangiales bacterium]